MMIIKMFAKHENHFFSILLIFRLHSKHILKVSYRNSFSKKINILHNCAATKIATTVINLFWFNFRLENLLEVDYINCLKSYQTQYENDIHLHQTTDAP